MYLICLIWIDFGPTSCLLSLAFKTNAYFLADQRQWWAGKVCWIEHNWRPQKLPRFSGRIHCRTAIYMHSHTWQHSNLPVQRRTKIFLQEKGMEHFAFNTLKGRVLSKIDGNQTFLSLSVLVLFKSWQIILCIRNLFWSEIVGLISNHGLNSASFPIQFICQYSHVFMHSVIGLFVYLGLWYTLNVISFLTTRKYHDRKIAIIHSLSLRISCP